MPIWKLTLNCGLVIVKMFCLLYFCIEKHMVALKELKTLHLVYVFQWLSSSLFCDLCRRKNCGEVYELWLF